MHYMRVAAQHVPRLHGTSAVDMLFDTLWFIGLECKAEKRQFRKPGRVAKLLNLNLIQLTYKLYPHLSKAWR